MSSFVETLIMKNIQRLLLSVALLSMAACTNAVPTSTQPSISFSAPRFSDGSTNKTYTISAYNQSLSLSGTCDSNTDAIELSFDNGVNWHLAVGGDVSCSGDGAFNINISDCSNSTAEGALGSYGMTGTYGFASPSDFRSIPVLLRSQSEFGTSNQSAFFISYSLGIKLRFASIGMGGAALVTGSVFQIRSLKIGAPMSTHEMSSASFKVKTEGH